MIKVEDIVKDLDNPTDEELNELKRLIRKEIKDNHKFYSNILADKTIEPESILSAEPRKPNRKDRRDYKKKVKK